MHSLRKASRGSLFALALALGAAACERPPAGSEAELAPAKDSAPANGARKVTGRVVDSAGRSIAGAAVEVRPYRDANQRIRDALRERRTVYCRGDGSFAVADLTGGYCTIEAFAPDHGFMAPRAVNVERSNAIDLTLILPPAAPYEGTLHTDAGLPAEGTKLSINRVAKGILRGRAANAEADRTGRFRFASVPDGKLTMELSRWKDRMEWVDTIEVDDRSALPTAITMPWSGTVVIACKTAAGTPLPESVVVELAGQQRRKDSPAPHVHVTTALREGMVRIENLQEWKYDVTLFVPGCLPFEARGIEVVSLAIARIEAVLQPRSERVSIQVRDQSGAPVPAATIELFRQDPEIVRQQDPECPWRGESDEFGRITPEWPCKEPLFLLIAAEGFATYKLADAHAHVRDGILEATLDPEAAFQVAVIDESGARVAGALLRVDPIRDADPRSHHWAMGYYIGLHHAKLPADGDARIGRLRAGHYGFWVVHEGEQLASHAEAIATGEGKRVVLRVPPLTRIDGRIRRNGENARGGTLWLVNQELRGTYKTIDVAEDGTFSTALRMLGVYSYFYCTEDGFALQGGKTRIDGASLLDLQFAVASLRARVLLPGGAPARHLRLGLRGQRGLELVTDDAGCIEIGAITPGVFRWKVLDASEGLTASADEFSVEGACELTCQLVAAAVPAATSAPSPDESSR